MLISTIMRPTLLPPLETRDGVVLVREAVGHPANPPVILAHGGGQTRHSWGETALKLAQLGWYAISYDHRGHGDSGWSGDKVYSFERFARDMQLVAQSCNTQPAVVGASLGGLSALVCGGEFDLTLFSAIVLVDVTPNLNREGVNKIFRFMGTHMERGFASLEEAANFISEFTGRSRREDASGLSKNLRLIDGRYYWHWDPNFFHLREGRKTDPERMANAARAVTVPVLLVRGRLSDVVTEVQVAEFREQVPHAEYVDVEHARHMVAGDRNDVFTDAVIRFLNQQITAPAKTRGD